MTFPVTASTLSADDLGVHLSDQYAMGGNIICKLFRTGMNHLYIVVGGNDKFVFRVYTHQWRTKVEIQEEIRLLALLKEHQVPATHPIADKHGNFVQEFNAPEGIRYGVMFSFAEGKKDPRFSAASAFHIGAALSRIHKVTENVRLERVTYDTHVLLHEAMAKTKTFFNKRNDEIEFLEKLVVFLQHEFEKVDISRIRHGAVHLDVWFDNLHIDDEKKVTIFDFDFCGNGWLCLDISYFLFQLHATHPNEQEYHNKASQFLEGYTSVTKISEEEKRILPFACLGVMVFYLSMQVDRYDNWSNIFLNEDHLKRFVGSLKRWVSFNALQID